MSRQEEDTTRRTVVSDAPDTGTTGTTTTTSTTNTTTGPTAGTVGTTGPVMTDTRSRPTVAGPVTWEEMRSLLRREPSMTERTWRPTVGGLLEILAGVWNALLGLGVLIGGTSFITTLIPSVGGVTGGIDTGTTGAGIFFLVIGVVAIIGGASALARRGWPWVLAGSIVSVFPSPIVFPFLFGILALIFNVLGHKEFWGPAQFQKDYQSNVEHNIDKSK